MDPATIQLYAAFIEALINGVSTLATALKSPVSPADLDVILGEVKARLARRGVADSTGTP